MQSIDYTRQAFMVPESDTVIAVEFTFRIIVVDKIISIQSNFPMREHELAE